MKYKVAKIHRPIYVYILTVLFGPLAGGLMSGLDYKKMGFKSWIIVMFAPSIISIIAIVLISLIYPNIAVPSVVLPIVLGYVYQIYQKQLEEKVSVQVPYYGFGYSLGISLIGMLVLLVPLALISM